MPARGLQPTPHSIQHFLRRHHYEQLHKKDLPQGTYQIWVCGRTEMVREVKEKILALLRKVCGNRSVRATEQNNSTILTIQWLNRDVELALLDVPEEGLFKITPVEVNHNNTEYIMRLFFSDFVEPARDTTGSVAARVNFWTPDE